MTVITDLIVTSSYSGISTSSQTSTLSIPASQTFICYQKSVTAGEGSVTIYDEAGLSITIPAGKTDMEREAFEGGQSGKTLTAKATVAGLGVSFTGMFYWTDTMIPVGIEDVTPLPPSSSSSEEPDEPEPSDSIVFTFQRYDPAYDPDGEERNEHPLSDGTITFTATGGTSQNQPVYSGSYDGTTYYLFHAYFESENEYIWFISDSSTIDWDNYYYGGGGYMWMHNCGSSSSAIQNNWQFGVSQGTWYDEGYSTGTLSVQS